jgi:arylformamidase
MHDNNLISPYVWISHELNRNTPAYGNGESLMILPEKQISAGNSCNSVKLSFSNHLGTHVDVPYHFIESGKKISDYSIDQWIFNKPKLVSINIKPAEIITLSMLKPSLSLIDDADLYWENSPAFSDDIALYLKENFPSILAIGFDTISLSSFYYREQNRELGRRAHRAFLSQGIRIFEDMHLLNLPNNRQIKKIIAMPLRFENADGSPCTMFAKIDIKDNE